MITPNLYREMVQDEDTERPVKLWQIFLKKEGLLDAEPNGRFGPRTHAATEAYQEARGLKVDGVVGPITLRHALQEGFMATVLGVNNFYTDVISKDSRFLSAKPVGDMALLEPITRKRVQAILAEAQNLGHNFMVIETYRSLTLQLKYYHSGASLVKIGTHHFGLSADIVRNVGGDPSWKGDFSILGVLAQRHGLCWGGNWTKFPDAVHVQRCALKKQNTLFAGTWYPDDTYGPAIDGCD
jgi:hypothetical protein